MGQEYIGTKQITAWPEMKDMLDGFAVQYADGYTSWSPKKVFEEAYLPIGQVKELPPHVQRVIGEKAQLDDRLSKLSAFLQTAAFKELPAKSQQLMEAQAKTTAEYSAVLKQRLEA